MLVCGTPGRGMLIAYVLRWGMPLGTFLANFDKDNTEEEKKALLPQQGGITSAWETFYLLEVCISTFCFLQASESRLSYCKPLQLPVPRTLYALGL